VIERLLIASRPPGDAWSLMATPSVADLEAARAEGLPIQLRRGHYPIELLRRVSFGGDDECWIGLERGSQFDRCIFVRLFPHHTMDLEPGGLRGWGRLSIDDPAVEIIHELGMVEGTPFIRTALVPGAGLDRLRPELSWPWLLALFVLARDVIARLGPGGYRHGRLTPARLRLNLGSGPPLVLCGDHPFVADGMSLRLRAPPGAELVDRGQLACVFASLGGARFDHARASGLLEDASPDALMVLGDLLLPEIPSPFDEIFVEILAASGSSVEDRIARHLHAADAAWLWDVVVGIHQESMGGAASGETRSDP
jgi:hypothetical protein